MDDYRISIVSQLILGVLYQIVSAAVVSEKNPILCASLHVRQLLMGHITGWSKGVCAVTYHVRTLFDHSPYGRDLKGCEEEGDCNLIPASPWHQNGAILGLGHQQRMMPHPSTSRQWWRQSQLSIILSFSELTSLKTDWVRKLVCL